MQNGITNGMKTAISVEDALMEEADGAARDLGVSRSALIARGATGLSATAAARTDFRSA